ncbi:MAPK/MAK/MRK overlapping kinase-like isoform X1 [Megalops cyprinoides]|uniref:MAPK/MAK/MRK overlapping kinase-like isoform X1 n=1 Tax=Megalops cyprinoides TaxID=118141 RepID=UPI0018646317|nr:MAPK/MAK/MRK overlapping kinase-like isoform X1 [Megalops cyprinoides]
MASVADLLEYGHLDENRRRSRNRSGHALSNILKSRDYKIIKKIGEGTFSEVVKTQSLKDGKYYACKTMKQPVDSLEQANNLREVQAMKRLSPHPNIIQLHEIIFDEETGSLSLVCELMEMNIYELIQGRQYPLAESKIKHYMYQLCKSLDHMHSNGIFHRDVKPENILIRQDVLKLADFGSCRSVYSKPPHTEYISTRWYRAPECLLTDGYYSHKMDMWSAGCVFFEIMSLNPLFPGSNELDQVAKIHEVLGTPDPSLLHKFKQSRAMRFDFPPQKGCGISQLIPHCSAPSLSLLYQMLEYDPEERISAKTALQHPCFRELRLAEKRASNMRWAIGTVEGAQTNGTPNSVDHLWRIARQGRRQHHIKHVADPLIRRNAPVYPVELPKLNVMIPPPKISFPIASLPALTISHHGSLPAIKSKKCQSRLNKQPRDETHRQAFKGYHMPPLERKHGGY